MPTSKRKTSRLEGRGFELRPYQEEALQTFEKLYNRGVNRQLLAAATGTGKTVVAAHLPEAFPDLFQRGMMMVAHRKELVFQAAETMRKVWPQMRVEIEMGDHRASPRADIVVGTVQTIAHQGSQRLQKYDRHSDIGLLVIDEAHHCSPGSRYSGLCDHFGVGPEEEFALENGRDRMLLGMTATPNRHDNVGLHHHFDEIAQNYDIRWGIEQGWLVDIDAQRIETDTDISDVGTDGGDFKVSELQEAVDTHERNEVIVKAFKEHGGSQGLAFTAGVDQAHTLADAFRSYGISAAAIDGSTEQVKRKDIVRQYKSGNIRVLTNCNVATEGFDVPGADTLLMARPTKSTPLYVQCLDEETEILTPTGFRSRDEIFEGHLVAGFEDGKIEWVPVEEKHERTLGKERMVRYESPSLDIRVTEGHRMLISKRTGRDKRYPPYSFSKAKNLAEAKGHHRLPISGEYQSERELELSDDEVRLIGWVISDGGINPSNNQLYIYQSDHQPYHDEIQSALEGCGLKYGTQVSQENRSQFNETSRLVTYYVSKGQPRGEDKHLRGWAYLSKYLTQDFPSELFALSTRQFRILIETINKADGNKQKQPYGESGWTRQTMTIGSANRQFIEPLQVACILHGYKANLSNRTDHRDSEFYLLHVKEKTYATVANQPDRPNFEFEEGDPRETVWCITNKLGTLVTRRNGKVAIMGNCVGRGTRPSFNPTAPTAEKRRKNIRQSEKPYMRILDFCDQVGDHDLMTAPQLFGLDPEYETGSETLTEAREKIDRMQEEHPGKPFEKAQSLDEIDLIAEQVSVWDVAESSVDELGDETDLFWMQLSDDVLQLQIPHEPDGHDVTQDVTMRLERDRLGRWQCIEQKQPVYRDGQMVLKPFEQEGKRYSTKEEALEAMDRYVRQKYGDAMPLISKGMDWQDRPATKGQLKYLRRLDVHIPDGEDLDRGKASRLINAAKAQK